MPELAQLLAGDGPDTAEVHGHDARCRRLVVDELEVDVLERVLRLAERDDVGAGRHERPGHGGRRDRRVRHGEDVRGRAVLMPAGDGGQAREDLTWVRERSGGRDRQRPGEQAVAELIGPADRAQGRVQDRDPVAQALGLLEAVRRQEDRHPLLAEPVDELVDLARGDRVEPRRRLVEEQHLRVAEQRPGRARPAGAGPWTGCRRRRGLGRPG